MRRGLCPPTLSLCLPTSFVAQLSSCRELSACTAIGVSERGPTFLVCLLNISQPAAGRPLCLRLASTQASTLQEEYLHLVFPMGKNSVFKVGPRHGVLSFKRYLKRGTPFLSVTLFKVQATVPRHLLHMAHIHHRFYDVALVGVCANLRCGSMG